MEKTSLVVKLADGTTTRPVGVVKDLKVKTLGLTYHVWFVVMDFKNLIDSYDIILGRDRKSTRLNSSHSGESRMPSSA